MRVIHPLKMDLVGPWGGNLLHMVQGDSNTRVVELRLFSNETEWIPTDVGTVSVAFKKPDQTKGLYDAEYTLEGNILQVVLHPQVLTAAGKVVVSIIIFTPEGDSVASFPFGIMVDKNPSMEILSSEDYFDGIHPFIAAAIQEAHAAAMEAYEAAESVSDLVGLIPKQIEEHNLSEDSHQDIRLTLKSLNDRLTAFFDSDDQTLDELSEIVAYITSNKSLIDSITINKISVKDIVDNLVTNVSNKPLSAAQGAVLKGLIDTLSRNLSGYLPTAGGNMRGSVNMQGHGITGLANPTANDQAANMGFVNQQVKKAAPRNLLDNSDFRNPVNQRGFESSELAAWGYCIDRWQNWADNEKPLQISLDSGGISAVSSNDTSWLCQTVPINDYQTGTRITAALGLAGGRFIVVSGEIRNAALTDYLSYDDGQIVLKVHTGNDLDKVTFKFFNRNNANSVKVAWAALYEGEYNHDTLPEYQPKGYAVELAECQRYFFRYEMYSWNVMPLGKNEGANNYFFKTPLPIPRMRAQHPSVDIKCDGDLVVNYVDGTESDRFTVNDIAEKGAVSFNHYMQLQLAGVQAVSEWKFGALSTLEHGCIIDFSAENL